MVSQDGNRSGIEPLETDVAVDVAGTEEQEAAPVVASTQSLEAVIARGPGNETEDIGDDAGHANLLIVAEIHLDVDALGQVPAVQARQTQTGHQKITRHHLNDMAGQVQPVSI